MTAQKPTASERAQLAMMLEVCSWTKPGNVDRCHDYHDTRLEHFLGSMIFCRPALIQAEEGKGSIGEIIRYATILSSRQAGGNTHFGAFILLVPLIMGDGIEGASRLIRQTTIEDAVQFYDAFSHCAIRVKESDDLDVNDPQIELRLRERGMTLYDVMAWSAPHDMVAREWTGNFSLTRKTADLILKSNGEREIISNVFLKLMADEPDTFIAKKFGMEKACEIQKMAKDVLNGGICIEDLDEHCIREGVNPGSLADIMIAALFIAISEGWQWDN